MVTIREVTDLIAQLGGLAILAGTLAAVAAVVHRWYVREEAPRGLALLVGLSGVAVYLNTTTALGQVIVGDTEPTGTAVALFNIAAFLVGAGGALVGRQAGDWFGTDVLLGRTGVEVDRDVGRLVQSVGRVTAVELPGDVEDVVGYDPVPDETKAKLAGKTFLFPRRLTVAELRERLVSRLKSDYGVGHVDVELAADGSVEYLGLGSRAAGIGPTLPPATNAVAVRADPAFAASAGDLVQVWETDPMRRVLTAELRGVAEDTVTVAIDASDTQKIDPRKQYRLVTLPVEDRPDREFASLLRAAEETFSSVTVAAGSPLHGMPVGALDLAVVAVKPDDEKPVALPDSTTVLAPGDAVYAIARPDALRRLNVAATPLDPSLASTHADRRPSSRSSAEQSPPADSATGAGAAASETADASGEDEAPAADTATDEGSETTGETTDADTAGEDGEAAATADTDESADADDAASSDFDPPAATGTDDPETAGKADEASFQQLKEEFESGGADWAEDGATDDGAAADAGNVADDDDRTEPADGEPSEESNADEAAFGDADDALDAAGDDPSFDDADDGGLDDLTFDESGGDDDLSFDESGGDDLDGLSFEDDEDEGLSLDDGGDGDLSFDDEHDTGDEREADAGDDEGGDEGEAEDEDDDEDDEDEDDGSGGGASSFQQLKEEFESGDADWEDDISDSPGGDMRLDE